MVRSAYETEPDDITAATISPDGGTVALSGNLSSAGGSGTAATWLWHPASGKTVLLETTKPRAGNENSISAQAFSPDGQILATGDSTAQSGSWTLQPGGLSPRNTLRPP